MKDEKKSNEKQTVWRANSKNKEDTLKWLEDYQRTTKTCWVVKEVDKVTK